MHSSPRSAPLLLDEMWSPAIAVQLRRRGHDVIAACEPEHSRYRSIDDATLLELASTEGRGVVTDNVADFHALHQLHLARGETHAGIVLALRPGFDRARPRVIGDMVRALDTLLANPSPDLQGRLVYLPPA